MCFYGQDSDTFFLLLFKVFSRDDIDIAVFPSHRPTAPAGVGYNYRPFFCQLRPGAQRRNGRSRDLRDTHGCCESHTHPSVAPRAGAHKNEAQWRIIQHIHRLL